MRKAAEIPCGKDSGVIDGGFQASQNLNAINNQRNRSGCLVAFVTLLYTTPVALKSVPAELMRMPGEFMK